VAIFGPTAPSRTGPFGASDKIIRANLECSPCFKRECNTIDCMKQITVDHVFEAAISAMVTTENTKKKK
jgi:ADP-heptose:LPS heptosyltransferase